MGRGLATARAGRVSAERPGRRAAPTSASSAAGQSERPADGSALERRAGALPERGAREVKGPWRGARPAAGRQAGEQVLGPLPAGAGDQPAPIRLRGRRCRRAPAGARLV
ncbi:MAG: hypothetical protein WKG07_48210 [Hymenobacter sp.]